MNDMLVKLNILRDILAEKKYALEQIHNICYNERSVFLEPHTQEREEMLKGIAAEKQKLVDKVIQYDNVFQKSFDSIKNNFEEQAYHYKEEINLLQSMIKQVMELDIKIRSAENENKEIFSRERNIKKQTNTLAKSYILKQYEKNNKKYKK